MSESQRVQHVDTIREIPCPTCGDPKTIDTSDLRPGEVVPCFSCHCHLVVTQDLTLAIARNEDMEKRPIREQEAGRMIQRIWSDIPHGEYC